MFLDHIAIVVDNLEATAEAWQLPDAQEIEAFPEEGTRELYFGHSGQRGRVLLMQPIGPGPYRRALEKRGPGLHHLAICVEDVRSFVSDIEGSGWLLHPASLDSYRSRRKVWLCRPGFPCLMEVDERSVVYDGAYVQEVSLVLPESLVPLLEVLNCAELRRTEAGVHTFRVEGRTVQLDGAAAQG